MGEPEDGGEKAVSRRLFAFLSHSTRPSRRSRARVRLISIPLSAPMASLSDDTLRKVDPAPRQGRNMD